MTKEEITEAVAQVLGGIAPEVDLKAISADQKFRNQADLDSMDFLNFIIGLHETLGVEIPEADYPKLATLNGCVDYLFSAVNAK